MSALQPIYNLPILYKQGGVVTVASNTTLSISAVLVRASNDAMDINIGDYFGEQSGPSATILNTAVVGLNGLDTGVLLASKVYAVWAIADEAGYNPAGFLLSLSATAPIIPSGVFPSGYSAFRRIGWAVTNSAVHFSVLTVSGQGNNVQYTYDVPIQVVTTGHGATQTAVDLSACVPAVNGIPVVFDVDLLPGNAAGDTVILCPSGGTIASSKSVVTGQITTVHITQQMVIPALLISAVPKVDYILSSASDTLALWVTGFVDQL